MAERPTGPPLPWSRRHGLPVGSAIAIPAAGFVVFRLVKHDPPTADDFRAMTHARAERTSTPELFRVGLSHYMTAEQAANVRTNPESMIARVVLTPDRRIHVARTEPDLPGHLEVWAPVDALLETAEVLEEAV